MTRTDYLLVALLAVQIGPKLKKWHRYIVSRQVMFSVAEALLANQGDHFDVEEDDGEAGEDG